ncbi:pilus assembly protein PilM [Lachnoclostridium sp. Marseille-P6806]|uniref:pilus assembly protein PilM n=1 Tax=Lachnoclostridium sp. Marseille-P6806 TaxID=2364793 RepID=UPI001030FE03|nr:pilus assembly protein PilM [Lachnoclostridium sp. Marseille-P6806]
MTNTGMIGIDIGNYRMKLVSVERGALRQAVCVELPDGMVRDGRIVAYSAMTDFLKETLREKRLRFRRAAVALPPETYYIRRVRLPRMTVRQLEVNLPYEFHDYISGDPGRYVYDYAVLSMDEGNMDLIACAAPKDLVNNYRVMLRRAGIRLVKLVPDVLAIGTILYHPERMTDPAKTKAELRAERKARRKEEKLAQSEQSRIKREQKEEEKRKRKAAEREARKLARSGFTVTEEDSRETDAIPVTGALSASFGVAPAEKETTQGAGAAGADRNPQPAPERSGQDYAVLDIGYRNTQLHFFSDGTYEITRTMDEGERYFAELLAADEGMDIHIALLKIESNQDDVLARQEIADRIDAFATAIMRVMNFYSYNNPRNSIDRIYYFGSGARLTPILSAVSQACELPLVPLTERIPGTDGDGGELLFGPQAYGAVLG